MRELTVVGLPLKILAVLAEFLPPYSVLDGKPTFLTYLQSQSKLLAHFAVFLPSQCWCARFGELTAINNIGRTRRQTRSKKQHWVEVSQLFLSETVGIVERCL